MGESRRETASSIYWAPQSDRPRFAVPPGRAANVPPHWQAAQPPSPRSHQLGEHLLRHLQVAQPAHPLLALLLPLQQLALPADVPTCRHSSGSSGPSPRRTPGAPGPGFAQLIASLSSPTWAAPPQHATPAPTDGRAGAAGAAIRQWAITVAFGEHVLAVGLDGLSGDDLAVGCSLDGHLELLLVQERLELCAQRPACSDRWQCGAA